MYSAASNCIATSCFNLLRKEEYLLLLEFCQRYQTEFENRASIDKTGCLCEMEIRSEEGDSHCQRDIAAISFNDIASRAKL